MPCLSRNTAICDWFNSVRSTCPKQRKAQLAALEMAKAPLQWALGPAKAQELMQRWTTWRLLSGLAGQPLAASVDGLAIGLESEANGVHLKARVGFG